MQCFVKQVHIAVEHFINGLDILRHSSFHYCSYKIFCGTHFHSSVKRKCSVINLLEYRDGTAGAIIAFEDLPPESKPGQFDFTGKPYLFIPRKKRYFAHLGEVDTHRILDPMLLDDLNRLFLLGRLVVAAGRPCLLGV